MRKVQLLFVCLMLSAAAFAADKVVKLPKPNLNRTGTVMKALSERQSTREYASKALTLADLSDLLWAANGINRSDAGKRTAPSAMNKQDVDVYVILSEGSYLYDAKNHQLNLIAEGDYRGAVAGGQAFVKTAPVSLVLISDVSRFGDAQKIQNQLNRTFCRTNDRPFFLCLLRRRPTHSFNIFHRYAINTITVDFPSIVF